uniref:Uncharacterized protein n=1 Tax=Ananas comosus var. bracteatus TaxID=296719 RepID=A0A6V7QD28_ANACO|nr:unnamed protein product [Ananas comosus var. bracteatus]
MRRSSPGAAAAAAASVPRRRSRVRAPGIGGGGSRRRWGGAAATPHLQWKLHEADRGTSEAERRNAAGEAAAAPTLSARKLAAGMWRTLPPESGGAGERRRGATLGFESNSGHLHMPITAHDRKNGILQKLEDCKTLTNSTIERTTKWDAEISKASDNSRQFHKLGAEVSFVSSLQSELEQARTRIIELEAEKKSSKKKLDHFLKKVAEEKALWRIKEHEKVRNIIDSMKDDLNRERKGRQRLEIVNSKLVNELTEAKLSMKKFLHDYEKERKARELMEEVCDELAKEIGEDKAEVEGLKRESMKIREEVEEERRMLQMAEVWREERVQMKLVDAKLTLEHKHSQLSNLQADLEAFLAAQAGTGADTEAFREAEMLREAISTIRIHDMKEFTYEPPPASEDIFSVFEELQPREDANEREIEQCYGFSPATSHASRIHTVSPETDIFLEKPTRRYTNEDAEEDSGWETVSHVEEQGSSNSPKGSDPSVTGVYADNNASVSGTDEISEVCSTNTRQSRKKGSSIVRLWRSSNGENCKKMATELQNRRVLHGRISNATLSPDLKLGDGIMSSPSVGQLSSPDSLNPNVAKGMKGCIEWRRGMQKHSLKAKLLEARMDGQKVQLRQVLKQKI